MPGRITMRLTDKNMEAIILIGIQAAGKTSFYRQRFADTHLHISLDMLKTRHREQILLEACIVAKQSFVVDNTNVTAAERAKHIESAKSAHFRVIGYYFQSRIHEAAQRNRRRAAPKVIPERGIVGTYNRLELPSLGEGFDELYFVAINDQYEFVVKEWTDGL